MFGWTTTDFFMLQANSLDSDQNVIGNRLIWVNTVLQFASKVKQQTTCRRLLDYGGEKVKHQILLQSNLLIKRLKEQTKVFETLVFETPGHATVPFEFFLYQGHIRIQFVSHFTAAVAVSSVDILLTQTCKMCGVRSDCALWLASEQSACNLNIVCCASRHQQKIISDLFFLAVNGLMHLYM